MKYRPVNVLPADWNRVKDFCRQAVLSYGPASPTLAAELMSTATLFVLWATKEEHAPLDYDGVFHPSLMGRYLRMRVSDKKSGAFKTLRSRLFRVGSAVTSVDHHKTKRDTAIVPVHEYTAGELAELEGWAATRNTDERRRYAYITLALMGGAGLAMTETLSVRGADIHHNAEGYTVRVAGRRARVVPVHADWERYLDEPSTHFIDDEHVLFPGQTQAGRATTLKNLYRGPHPAPNPQWLRDTWLLQLLRTLPLSIIMQAVGTSDVVRFRRYFDTAHLDFDQWQDAVRNPAAYRARMDTTRDSDGAYGDDLWRTSYQELRHEAATVTVKLADKPAETSARSAGASDSTGDTPHPPGRRRPRDEDHGKYARRPRMVSSRLDQVLTADSTAVPAVKASVPFKRGEQPLTADSTAIPAGIPAASFKRAASTERGGSEGSRPVGEGAAEPRPVSTLEDGWSPKRPRKTSRFEALPPGSAHRPALSEGRAPDNATDADAKMFTAIREALLAEARRSARGGKR
ncbi:hypothetical protein [Curtobacterium luteum]|uniref:hypothetical protein n=1 Tax=Curtobacterium luteum TaxID=33881 RepID=UPI003804CEBD